MKKIMFLLAILVMVSCSVEPVDDFITLDSKAKTKSAETATEEFVIPDNICAGENVTFSINAPLKTNMQVKQFNPESEEWDIQVFQISKSTSDPQTFTWNFPTAGDYQWKYKAGSGGFSEPFTISVNSCCQESFTYQGEGETYSFTYVPEEDMENAHLVFTFAQAVEVTGFEPEEDWNWHGQTMQTTKSLLACTPVTWELTILKKCDGNTSNNNLWTDFKVNDISKKGDLENIVQACE